MSQVESKNVPISVINLYLHRLHRADCLRSMDAAHPRSIKQTVLIQTALKSNFELLVDSGYRNEAIESLRIGIRIQTGPESQRIKPK